jgi:uncharacterized repeat protein (TIGR03803 family)
MDAHGNIFAVLSAAFLAPSIVELSPNGKGSWTPTLFHAFGNDIFPESAPVLDSAGNVYGTTQSGGVYNSGTVYELSPEGSGKWTEKILYSFGGSKTAATGPFGPIAFDAQGNIYGTTTFGGASNAGTVFELTPDGQGSYQEKVLWSFDLKDGAGSLSGVTLDSAGNIFGVAPNGGGGPCDAGPDVCGVAFEVIP